MKKKIKKTLSMLVVLCMVIGLLPGMTATAAAAASNPYVTVNNNVYLSEAKPYYVNGKAQSANPGDATFGSNGYTAKLTLSGTDATLTLKNYNGGRIYYRYGNLTVEVNDSNVIDSPRYEGIGASGNLTVQGGTANKETDSLTVTSANGCISADGELTIQYLKELNCSSTAVYNNCVKGNGALTLQNIGIARISLPNAGVGYAAILGRTSVSVTDVTDLEANCGGDCVYSSSSVWGGISITGTGTKVALYSKAGNAICNYGGNVSVDVGTLIAVTDGGIAIRAANYSSTSGAVSASVTATSGLYVKGQVVQSSEDPTVKLNGTDISRTDGVYSGTGSATTTATAVIRIENGEKNKTYSGQPVTVAVTSSVAGLTYIYTWYDESGNPLGSSAPVDAGKYKLRVYAYGTKDNVAYTGDTGTTLIEVTISRADAPAEYKRTDSADITNGNNLITLPEIPSGMVFGTPEAVTRTGEAEHYTYTKDNSTPLTLSLSGNLLSVQASNLGSTAYYYVKVPVVAGSKSNYNDYDDGIILTLTNLTGMAIFDRCDGSEPALVDVSGSTYTLPNTGLYDASTNDNDKGAWEAAIGKATMYGYQFDGWYTAPNGWGEQKTAFEAGTTYYAHWVWTRSYVDYVYEDNVASGTTIYAILPTSRTVYTTCLDFSDHKMDSDKLKTGSGYEWDANDNTLILSGLHIQALDSVCGIILPAESTIKLVSLTGENGYNGFCDDSGNEVSEETAAKYANYRDVSNIISCGSVEGTADVFCQGSLKIQTGALSDNDDEVGLGNWLDVRQGGIKTAAGGTLTVRNANIGSTRLCSDGNITIYNSLVFATDHSSTFTGDRYVRSDNGSVTIDQSWVFTDWLQAKENLSISGRESRVWVSFGASADETISISDSGYKKLRGDTYNYALNFGDQESALWGLYAKDIRISNSLLNSSAIMTGGTLTVSGGSEVNAHGSQMMMPMLLNGASSISNSTVNVTGVTSGSVGIYGTESLTINSSTVTVSAANGATPAAAILVSGVTTDPGLVLNSSALTSPSGYSLRKITSDGEDTAYWSFAMSEPASMAGTVTIVPVSPVIPDIPSTSDDSDSSDDTPDTYPVTAPAATEGGSVSVSSKNAVEGKTVTITVTPDKGYVLDKLTVTDSRGNALAVTNQGNGKYTFTMPAGRVKISAEFKEKAPTPAYESFADLGENAWYQSGVRYVLDNGLMKGVEDGKFAPNGTTSRAMVATVLWRLAGSPQTGAGSTFTDVPAGSWCADAVAWAAELGITNGYGDTFRPNGSITREQLAAMLYRFAQSQGKGFTDAWMMNLDYPDAASVSDWAYEPLCWMTMNGIIEGKDSGLLDPKGQATRAQVAVTLMRFAESME